MGRRVVLPRHGRNHRPGGSDPIPFSFTEEPTVWGTILRSGGAGNLGITSGAIQTVTTIVGDHNTVLFESGVDCDIVSSPTRIGILEDGVYLIRSHLTDADSTATDYSLCVGIEINTTTPASAALEANRRIVNGGTRLGGGIFFYDLTAGDYIVQAVGQNSGSTKTFGYLAELTVARIPGAMGFASVGGDIDGGSP